MVQKVKIISWSWNLVPTLIRICRIQLWCSLFCFWVEMLFLGKFGPKDEIVSSRWNSRFKLFQICRIQWWRSLFLFLSENTLFGQIWSKKLKFLFQAEIWYLHEFEHAEFNGGVHFFCFWVEMLFLGKFGPKSQNYQFKLKFATYTNSNMQNSMVMFTFSVFDPKHPF